MTAKVLCIWNSSNSGVWKQSKGLGDVRATEGLRIRVVWRRRREMPLSIQFLAIGLGGQMLSGTMMSNSISISGFFLLCGRPLFPSPKSLCRSYQIKTALCACCVEESIENELHHMDMEGWGRGGFSSVQCDSPSIPQQQGSSQKMTIRT